ncbi:hypothetical protein AR546_07360 [Leptospira interrogans serovar Canicola]|uniref:Uncharacterized protein n=1 Tax=Leptospira interrogans serovar Canicola TaxID=211880 RepID=A0A067YBC0_LEPIR|nr:hypothetical protein [Leptospira interrogans]OQM30093.1 hypothetical protein DV30_12465 [Leptospira interrogans serovar Canicola str. Gui44]AGZ84970.1 hypothetical protein [Leptospira interrogans serovar Canicola]MCR8629233.1 hypothetical protein [Leptospira interrogans serovar Canicola]OLZ32091.1 hypothetical protein AR546_07360 [Leptospira interrogans serovar Canicola]POR17297.1 hypothetical protein B0T34_15650 [Leptospira interrogans serovar Canicola]
MYLQVSEYGRLDNSGFTNLKTVSPLEVNLEWIKESINKLEYYSTKFKGVQSLNTGLYSKSDLNFKDFCIFVKPTVNLRATSEYYCISFIAKLK